MKLNFIVSIPFVYIYIFQKVNSRSEGIAFSTAFPRNGYAPEIQLYSTSTKHKQFL